MLSTGRRTGQARRSAEDFCTDGNGFGDVDGTVAKVEFLANGSVMGQSTSTPYGMTWTPGAVRELCADGAGDGQPWGGDDVGKFSDGEGKRREQHAADGDVDGSGGRVEHGARRELCADRNGGDVDGTVSQVEFLANGSVVGQSTSAPYGMTWTPATVGSYVLTARATDNLGAVTMSANSATVTVTSTTTTTVVLQRGLTGYAGVRDTFLNSTATTGAYGAFNPLYLNSTLYRRCCASRCSSPRADRCRTAWRSSRRSWSSTRATRQHAAAERAVKPWVEAQATWNQSQTGVPWSVAGAAGAGTDYDTNTDALVSVGFNPGWVAFDVTPRVQKWSSKTIANYGWR